MATNPERVLLNALTARQEQLGHNDGQMAAAIGVSPALWCLLKQEKRPMGKLFLQGVLQRFPEFTSEVLLVLRGNVTTVTRQRPQPDEKTSPTTQEEEDTTEAAPAAG